MRGAEEGVHQEGAGSSAGASVWGRIPWEGSISVGPGWLSRILQADRDGNVHSRQSKSAAAGQWQQPVCRAGLHVGVFGEAVRPGS